MKFYANYVNKKFCVDNGFPRNLSLQDFIQGNKKYYQEVEDYDWVEVTDNFRGLEAILHHFRENQTLKLIRKFGQGQKYLDVGCGTGLMLRHLPKGTVGLDINPRNIAKAIKHAPKAKLVLGDIENIPFQSERFSTIVCTEVIEHLPNPHKALKEILRVLSPQGIFIGSVPVQNLIWKLRFLSSTHPGEPYHHLYQKKELETLLEKMGNILKLKKGNWGMNLFFVIQKRRNKG